MWQPGDGKRASFEGRCCPRVLSRRRRFFSKCLLFVRIDTWADVSSGYIKEMRERRELIPCNIIRAIF